MKYEQLRNAEAIADAVIRVERRILSLGANP